MPNPTHGDVHISHALTNVSVAYSQARTNFVAESFAPLLPVDKQFGQYFVYAKCDWLRSDAGERAPGTEAPVSGWDLTTSAYACDRKALAHDVADPERANADAAINLDADATEYVTEQIMLAKEVDFMANYFTTAVWDGASSSTDMTGQAAPASTSSNFLQWNDVGSNPIEDIEGEATAVAQKTGKRPNKLLLGPEVWTALKSHPDILDRIKYTERGVVTTDLLAALLDLEEVRVGWVTRNTGVRGGTASYSFEAGKAALLAYVENAPGIKKPSAAYTFVWTGQTAVPLRGVRIKRYRLERNESDRIEGETWFDHVVVATDLGAFFATAVA